MIQRKQLFLHRPAEGQYGDCHRTAIACLLDLEPDQVPHFLHDDCDGTAFRKRVDAYLRTQGLVQVEEAFNSSLADVLLTLDSLAPHVYYLLGGKSKTGCNHTVIGCGGEIVWDPSPAEVGIVGPCSDGMYWITFLVPLRFQRAAA
jgi:hypothetical protein